MIEKNWFQIKFTLSQDSVRDALLNFLFEQGALGSEELTGEKHSFLVSFEGEKHLELEQALVSYILDLKESNPNLEIDWEINLIQHDNWSEKYKEFYRAQKLTDRFFLRPRWDLKTEIPSSMFPIFLDPGQAFGTGLHASTRLSIKLMEDITQLYPSVRNLSMIDVGTGSGILAISAFHLGFGKITAIDNDLDAVEVAKENLKFNKTTNINLSGTPIEKITETFDVIVANILLETHLLLADQYKKLLNPGGLLVLAGLLGGQIRQLEESLFARGFVPQQKYWLQDWAACSYTFRVHQ